jgi:hypothetical protein
MARQYNEMQLSSFVDQIFTRLERIETQLKLVSDAAGVPMEDPRAGIPEEIVELVRSGDRMGAVIKHRELFGSSLQEAQAAIEAI